MCTWFLSEWQQHCKGVCTIGDSKNDSLCAPLHMHTSYLTSPQQSKEVIEGDIQRKKWCRDWARLWADFISTEMLCLWPRPNTPPCTHSDLCQQRSCHRSKEGNWGIDCIKEGKYTIALFTLRMLPCPHPALSMLMAEEYFHHPLPLLNLWSRSPFCLHHEGQLVSTGTLLLKQIGPHWACGGVKSKLSSKP